MAPEAGREPVVAEMASKSTPTHGKAPLFPLLFKLSARLLTKCSQAQPSYVTWKVMNTVFV